jgi:hypothetical protein
MSDGAKIAAALLATEAVRQELAVSPLQADAQLQFMHVIPRKLIQYYEHFHQALEPQPQPGARP